MNLNFDKTDRLIEIIENTCRVLMRIEHGASSFLHDYSKPDFKALCDKLVDITNSDDDDEATKRVKRECAFADYYRLRLNKEVDGKGMLEHIFNEAEIVKDITQGYWQIQPIVTYRPVSDYATTELKEFISNRFPDEPYKEIAEQVLLKEEPMTKDLEVEFWANCPDVNQIDAFCNIYRERWKGSLKQVDTGYYDVTDLLFDETNKLHQYFAVLRKCGLLSINERFVEARLCHIAQDINYRCDSVVEMFQKLRASTKPTESKPTIAPMSKSLGESDVYEYDPNRIVSVHYFCSDDVFKGVSAHQFGKCVANANFREIYDKSDTVKSKLKYTIFALTAAVNSTGWGSCAAESIGFNISDCSGANIDEKWKSDICKITGKETKHTKKRR